MLLYKLLEMEHALETKRPIYCSQLKAIMTLKKALLKIDLNVEEIPEHSFKKLKCLFEDIINRQLIEDETLLLKEIIRK